VETDLAQQKRRLTTELAKGDETLQLERIRRLTLPALGEEETLGVQDLWSLFVKNTRIAGTPAVDRYKYLGLVIRHQRELQGIIVDPDLSCDLIYSRVQAI
jgi:hypothetical protein